MKNLFIKFRSVVLVFLTHKIALPLLKLIRKPNSFDYSKEDLRMFPSGSLGNDLYLFLEKRNLPLLKHYVRHDLKHVLLNYDTTDEGEACLQCYMLGNGRISFPVFSTVFYALVTMPEYWKKMLTSYKQGKNCTSIHSWRWNEMVRNQTLELRNKIFNYS